VTYRFRSLNVVPCPNPAPVFRTSSLASNAAETHGVFVLSVNVDKVLDMHWVARKSNGTVTLMHATQSRQVKVLGKALDINTSIAMYLGTSFDHFRRVRP
jgi:hypothetical protein